VPHQSALFLSVHDAALICEQKALITAEHQLCEGPTTPAKCADCIAERRRLSTNHQTLTALAQGVDLQGRFIQSIVRRMDHVFVSTQEHLTTLADFDISGEALSKRRHGIPHTPSLPATPSPTLRFTCMNNLGMVHGLDHLLSSFARIAGPRVELNIYGEEQTDLDLHALGVDLNQLSISYRGPCRNEHLPHILSQTDVGVVPFRHEHCSRAARQFLHAGIPVIAADSGGTPELVTHGVNGRLFQPNDRDSMVAALTFFLEHPHALPAYRANTQRQRLIDDDARELLRLYQQARPQTNAGLSHRT
jgi:glycosyltransferase involved in cell wall biosynthesis